MIYKKISMLSILFILSFLIFTCKYKKTFIDIDGPLLEKCIILNQNILFKYNEPVLSSYFIMKHNRILIKNRTPSVFINVPATFFNIPGGTLLISTSDLCGNQKKCKIPSPIINNNPIKIIIKEIRIKYTKKRKQKIVLQTKSSGNINGYKLIIYIKGEKKVIPFNNEKLNKNKTMIIYIDSVKYKDYKNNKLSFKKNPNKLFFKYRLSMISSLILLKNHKGEIIDYFLYYNTKKHNHEYFLKNKNYCKFVKELKSKEIKIENYDIEGITSKKTIKKINNKFIITE